VAGREVENRKLQEVTGRKGDIREWQEGTEKTGSDPCLGIRFCSSGHLARALGGVPTTCKQTFSIYLPVIRIRIRTISS